MRMRWSGQGITKSLNLKDQQAICLAGKGQFILAIPKIHKNDIPT
jgi:hypothetical protein